jgi:hypothetical protein
MALGDILSHNGSADTNLAFSQNGKTLVYDSGESTGLKKSVIPGTTNCLGFQNTARYYSNPHSPRLTGGTAISSGGSRMWFVPIYIPYNTTVTRLGCKWVTAAGATEVCRMGIYTSVAGRPNILLVDGGSLDANITTAQEVTISMLLGGTYWLALQKDAAGGGALDSGGGTGDTGVGFGTMNNDTTTTTAYISLLTDSNTYTGALPNDVSASTFSFLNLSPTLWWRAT